MVDGIQLSELAEASDEGVNASKEFEGTNELSDNMNEAKKILDDIDPETNPGIKEIQEDVNRRISEIRAKLNKMQENYQNGANRFHDTLANTVEKQTGTKIPKNEMEDAIGNYKPEERTGDPKQDAVNETLDKATKNLKDNLPAKKKTFLDYIKSGLALGIIGGAIVHGLYFDIVKSTDKTLDEIVQGAAGCYQKITDDKGVVYYVGPCKCGFDLDNKAVTCANYDSTKSIADQVKDAAFCQQSTFSNLKTPCLISKVACT